MMTNDALVDSEYDGNLISYKCHGYTPPHDETTFVPSIVIHNDEPLDAMLVNVRRSPKSKKGIDQFIVLQLIKRNCTFEPVCLYARYGETGSLGRAFPHVTQTCDEGAGVRVFKDTFRLLTGVRWEARNSSQPVPKRFCYVKQNMVEKRTGYESAKWQCFVSNTAADTDDDNISSPAAVSIEDDDNDDENQQLTNGWTDFDPEIKSSQLEHLYQEYVLNTFLANRTVVDSCGGNEGSYFDVSFKDMTLSKYSKHSNFSSRHVNIRRCPIGAKTSNSLPMQALSALGEGSKKDVVSSGEVSTNDDNDDSSLTKMMGSIVPDVQLKIYDTFLALRTYQYHCDATELSKWIEDLHPFFFIDHDGPTDGIASMTLKKVELDESKDLPRHIRLGYNLYNHTAGTIAQYGSASVHKCIFDGFEEIGVLILHVSTGGYECTGFFDEKTFKCYNSTGEFDWKGRTMDHVLDDSRDMDFQEDCQMEYGSDEDVEKYREMISEKTELDATRKCDEGKLIFFDEFTDLRPMIKP